MTSMKTKRSCRRSSSRWATLVTALVCVCASIAAGGQDVTRAGPVAADQVVKQRDALVKALAQTLSDKALPSERRAEAATALGQVRGRAAVLALLENIELKVAVGVTKGDSDLLKQFPAVTALQEMDWEAVPAILEFLERPRDESVLVRLLSVLNRAPGKSAAVAILSWKRTDTRPQSDLASNLEQLLAMLKRQ